MFGPRLWCCCHSLSVVCALSLLVVLTSAIACRAERAELDITAVTVIENPADSAFVGLIAFDGLESLEDANIDFARILLPHVDVSAWVRLTVYPLTRAWDDEDVSWTFPWDSLGGDFDASVKGVYDIYPQRDSGTPVWLDITEHVWEMHQGRDNYGLLIAPSSPNSDVQDRRSVEEPAREVFETPGALTLEVYYWIPEP